MDHSRANSVSIGRWLCLSGLAMALVLPGCKAGGGAKSNSRSIMSLVSPPTPQEAAAWAVDPYDADKRQRGILLLANASWGGAPVYVDLYEAALEDGDHGVQASAIKALGLHGRPDQAEAIAEKLATSDDRMVRWEAARALQRLHNPEVVETLIARLDPREEEDYDIRASAATALGQYAENRVLDGLMGALDDPSLLVNVAATEALATLTGQDFGDDVRAWLAWSKETEDPFAGRQAYIYPVFYRKPSFLESIVPFMQPPNEVAAAPAGMPASAPAVAGSGDSGEPAGESVRQN